MNNRQETVAAYERLMVKVANDDELRHYVERELAKSDLFYLLVNILGRNDVNRDWLYDRCREVEAAPDGYLDLWPREYYKSTIITYGKTIQDILCDPEITIGIFSYSRPIAKAFLRQIKREFEANETLRLLFRIFAGRIRSAMRQSGVRTTGLLCSARVIPKRVLLRHGGWLMRSLLLDIIS